MLIFQENTSYSSYNLNTKRDNLFQDQHSQALVLQQCPPAVNSDIFTQEAYRNETRLELDTNSVFIHYLTPKKSHRKGYNLIPYTESAKVGKTH